MVSSKAPVAPQLLPTAIQISAGEATMAETIEQMLREVFGDSLSRLTNFESEQVKKLTSKLQEIARDSIKEDFVRMEREISELRERVATLETERAQKAADGLESAF